MRFSGLVAVAYLTAASALAPGNAQNRVTPLQKLPPAQKAVLYEEDLNNPDGVRSVGGVIWRTEQSPRDAGQTPETVIRGDIDIPDRKISVNLSLRRNDDPTLPASHTVEILFRLPPDFSHGGIASVLGILAKQGDTTRGNALKGAAVRIENNRFMIGLESGNADNVKLLKERVWFDIPAVYSDGKRAVFAVEKGAPGERAFSEAFAAWEH
jgi:hypothetical protein